MSNKYSSKSNKIPSTMSPFDKKSNLRLGKRFESLKKLSQKSKDFQSQNEGEYSAKVPVKTQALDYSLKEQSWSDKKPKKSRMYGYHPNVKIKVELYSISEK